MESNDDHCDTGPRQARQDAHPDSTHGAGPPDLPVSACSSGPAASTAAGTVTPQTVTPQTTAQQACEQVGDVLADGPDPDADPVGHAEAQILPLRQIHIPDATLGRR